MTLDGLTMHDRVPPPEWVAALRAVSPKSETHSWAWLRWLPTDQRWALYEMVPFAGISELWHELLQGPHPDTDPDSLITPFQWEMYRAHRVHARPMWIIQGTNGGHLYTFDQATRELAKAAGRPAEPPAPGALPYAPFDQRVVRQLIQHDRLTAARRDLAQVRKQSTGAAYLASVREAKKEARAAMLRFIDAQFGEADEFVTKATKAGELDDTKPVDRDWVRDDEIASHRFIETGRYHAVQPKASRIWVPT